jgi:5-bromo-4-chloroindolyl phosphate hydrolysis protein
MKNKDIHKKVRDSMDETLETKFMQNLQWSMLFFCFNSIANNINEENEFAEKYVHKEFIKTWKKFANQNIASSDLKMINDILNSPKNVFYSALQNSNEITESTEIYQEKYNNILNKIEKFFLNTLSSQQNFESPEENDDNNYA